jgi:7 transmembrane receptor (rhodopsin family)
MFIINLSVSDLMFCCFNLPLATSLFYKRAWLLGDTLCILFPFMRYGLLAVSIFTVLAITLNRYIMIGHPRLYPK